MKKILFFVIVLVSTSSVFAQKIAKNWNVFRTGSSAERVKAAEELTKHYLGESIDSLRVIGEDLFFYGIDEHYFPAIEKGKQVLAEYYVNSGRTTEGIITAKSLLSNIQERGDEEQLSITCRIISSGYRAEKDAKSAFFWAEKAVRHAKKCFDPQDRMEGTFALAEAYLMKNDSKKAIARYKDYLKKSKSFASSRSLSAAYARLGDIYRLTGDLAQASNYFNLAFQQASKGNLITPIGHALNNLAIISFEQGDTVQARIQFEKAMKLRIKANDLKAISESYFNMGDYHFYIGKMENATRWYMKSLDFSQKNGLRSEQKDALNALAELSKSTLDYKGATSFLEQCLQVNEEMRVQQLSDEEEIAQLQMELYKLEAENNIPNTGKNNITEAFRWEWFAILFLIVLVLVLLKSKKQSKTA